MKIIKNEIEYQAALHKAALYFDNTPQKNTKEGDEFEVLLLIIKDYEDKHFVITAPNPIEIIKLKMKEMGLKNVDLVPLVGSKSYVSQVLNYRKPLTANMMKVFYQKYGVPASLLLG